MSYLLTVMSLSAPEARFMISPDPNKELLFIAASDTEELDVANDKQSATELLMENCWWHLLKVIIISIHACLAVLQPSN